MKLQNYEPDPKARYDQQTEGLAGLSYQDTVFMNGIE
jgi:hypothetical protein